MSTRVRLLVARGTTVEVLEALVPGAPPREVARPLKDEGACAVLVLQAEGPAWLASQHADGWVSGPSVHGVDPAALAGRWQECLQRGFVAADAALLALVAREERAAAPLPLLTWDETPSQAVAGRMPEPGLYAIVDAMPRLRQVVEAGVRTVQLRVKTPPDADARWHQQLRGTLAEATALTRSHGAVLVVNDHWRLAIELGAPAVHLGQEDLGRLTPGEFGDLSASGVALGISSHAVWELCRARSLQPAYVACGPVWPTVTKDMPWRPQGLDNLAWWCAQAGAPVVAIGGILTASQVRETARAGASGVCVLRGLGDDPARVVPALQEAFAAGRAEHRADAAPAWPHPSLEAAA